MSIESKLSQNSSKSHQTSFDAGNNSSVALKDLQNAKMFLMQCGPSGDSLLSHLSNVVAKVIDERPSNVVDYFEQFSQQVRLETFRMNENLLEEGYKEPERIFIAQKLLPSLVENLKQPVLPDDEVEEKEKEEEELQEEQEDDVVFDNLPVKDLGELQFYWNLLGIGLAREEVFQLQQSISKISKNPSTQNCRFWGKILCLKNDYYIVECTLTETALDERIDHIEEEINKIFLDSTSENNDSTASTSSPVKSASNESKLSLTELQKETENYPSNWNFSMKIAESQYREPIEIPAEDIGHGVNRLIYFVTTDLTSDWIELPPATPHQINVSRRIKKFLTGDLEEQIFSYPAFPGTERNYLRALIARISASTNIAPRNFYTSGTFGEEEFEEDDEDEERLMNNDKPIKTNPSYRPLSISKLQKLDYWEHVKPEILKQGRVSYFDGNILNLSEIDDKSDISSVEEEETKPNINEVPVPLFASCSGDRLLNEGVNAWTIRLSEASENFVLAQSHLWPGAFAFAKEKICDTIYIGHGQKFSNKNFSPLLIPQIGTEYCGSEITERNDPTIEEEDIFLKKVEVEHELSEDEMNEDQES